MKTKFLLTIILAVIFSVSFGVQALAYTENEVAEHSSTSDCWMIYDGGVYDFTDYLRSHDRYLDIKDWCGQDMTQDFETKAGIGRDHRSSSYALLDNYYIGELDNDNLVTDEEPKDAANTVEITDTSEKTTASSSGLKDDVQIEAPYNLAIPLFGTIILYIVFYIISGSSWGKRYQILSRRRFNFFWNTVLFLSLIPALGFGIFMMLRYRFPSLYDINFDFMYWHVELSVVMGVVCLMHLIQRWRQYTVGAKKIKIPSKQ